MKKETLEKANDLKKNIEQVEYHLNNFNKVKNNCGYKSMIIEPKENPYSNIKLYDSCLPIPMNSFIELYKINVELKLKKLIEEFDQLKD